ncbi:MAG: AAA domain-containing protein [Anaerolineae bacterium]|nr:AAA domain-containing protein [Anaerolineae bacterium]
MGYRITDDIEKLKAVLPSYLIESLEILGDEDNLIEIIMDLGRVPTARFVQGEEVLDWSEITREHLDYVISKIGEFDADNRAGIERTLHRISAIRNRKGDIVGLTCRIGRAVYGTIEIIREMIESGQSVLMLGPPGVGKTTMLRESARVLAERRRVVIVDTSNEIGGDGDVPHPSIGRARRMQVAEPKYQHEVMIEAVENHNPEVIVIDEIGRELEAVAARTIAERGVQLIGTAHGNVLENILMNPTLSDLVGGIESVTLSDDEARRRGTQKTVLERRNAPTFDVLIELQSRDRLIVHEDVAAAVDAHLRGMPFPAELRYRDMNGQIHVETVIPETQSGAERKGRSGKVSSNGRTERRSSPTDLLEAEPGGLKGDMAALKPMRAFAYGVARNRLVQSAKRLNVPLTVVDNVEDAEIVVTLKNYYRQRPRLIVDAERMGISIYVLRANTVTQMEDFLFDVFELESREDDPSSDALKEAESAIRQVRVGKNYVDLKPQPSHLRRRQHDMARQANLISHSYGTEPNRYVRIFQSDPGEA